MSWGRTQLQLQVASFSWLVRYLKLMPRRIIFSSPPYQYTYSRLLSLSQIRGMSGRPPRRLFEYGGNSVSMPARWKQDPKRLGVWARMVGAGERNMCANHRYLVKPLRVLIQVDGRQAHNALLGDVLAAYGRAG